jgi:4-hydroxythreonine-4-phosphate dehydrogenase
MSKPILAITMGDPAGIGPEIIVKALQHPEVVDSATLLVIANESVIRQEVQRPAFSYPIRKITDIGPENLKESTIYLIDPTDYDLSSSIQGTPTAIGGKAAANCIIRAVELALAKKVDGIITAPISKEALHMAGFFYPGHTEFLAELTQTNNFAMMLAAKSLRVVPVTTHMALSSVPEALSKEKILSKIQVLHDWLTRFVKVNPRIAICALNPHAGDGGIFGTEEAEKIKPAISAANKEGIKAEGPYPADALFSRMKKESYGAIVTMYHDQALIPLKMTAFGEAVNITIGLPIIRTSVDHGTAYDIAGKNQACPTSLIKAIGLATRLVRDGKKSK